MNDEDRATNTVANVESTASDAPLGAEEMPRFDTPVRVSFHSIRKRLADSDGISGKAALDGLVHGGVLQDDSPKHVQEVKHSQEKGKQEKTIITIEKI